MTQPRFEHPFSAQLPRALRIRSLAAGFLALLALATLMPGISEAARGERQPLDRTILERQAELTPQMTRAQRLQLLRIEEAIEQAKSDLRSGQFMVETEDSPMQPRRDVKAIINEGKRIVAEAEAAIYENEKALIELLQAVDQSVNPVQAVDDSVLELALPAATYTEAIETACRSVMEACWQKNYEALFFHEAFIRDADGLRPAGTEVRNEIYDTLVHIDGTNFTLTLPVDFALKADATGTDESSFSYENEAAFAGDKKALLVIEIMHPENASTALLSVRAINLANLQIAAAELIKVSNIAEALAFEPVEDPEDPILEKAELRGGAVNLARVANLPEPYHFELQSEADDPYLDALMLQTLFENSELILVDSAFIKEAYGSSLSAPESWQSPANGRVLASRSDSENTFELGLQVIGSQRTLPAGTLMLGTAAAE
jgi:hypothetical protein